MEYGFFRISPPSCETRDSGASSDQIVVVDFCRSMLTKRVTTSPTNPEATIWPPILLVRTSPTASPPK